MNGTWYAAHYVPLTLGTWYEVEARVANNQVSVYFDGQPLSSLQNLPITGSPTRAFGLGTYNADVEFDDVYVIYEDDGSGGSGNILYSTDFDTGEDFNEVVGSWSHDATNQWYRQSYGSGATRSWHAGPTSTNAYTLKSRLRLNSGSEVKLIFANADLNEEYGLDVMYGQGVRPRINGTWYPAHYVSLGYNVWYDLEARLANNQVSVYLDGQPLSTLQNLPITGTPTRAFALGTYNAHAEYDNAYVYDDTPASKEALAVQPETYRLWNNHPNPFNPETTLVYEVPEETAVQLAIYNLLGQPIRTLVAQRHPPGRYRVEWDGRDQDGRAMASGVYFYRLQADRHSDVRKMTLIR